MAPYSVGGRTKQFPLPLDIALQNVDVAEKLRNEARRRARVDLTRRTYLLELSGAHHRNTSGHHACLLLVVRDHDEGGTEPALHLFQLELRLLAKLAVERRQRLVEQQKLRPFGERASERNALLLPTGKLIRPPLGQPIELDQPP